MRPPRTRLPAVGLLAVTATYLLVAFGVPAHGWPASPVGRVLAGLAPIAALLALGGYARAGRRPGPRRR